MDDLVLLKDEVEFLHALRLHGGVIVVGEYRSDDVRADFLCDHGLTVRRGEILSLTPFGERVADKVSARHLVEVAILTGYEIEQLRR
ncbi:hypothetical protein [Planctomyces sp. SH-PL14]|uniref:hypothetical protein n=1 Tax=Planctomyces sp. SH-PL14 TaxID=1632864 RepID=UPI00078DCE4C|nr:hypothetical protein [Planctomyces sp. SH-PL14]AMV16463.1 hypothetical protein VT03_01145 [Planctomyces sp. SH-PL14]